MVICDTNIIGKYLFKDPLVLRQINLLGGMKNIYITPIVYIEIIHWLSSYQKFTREDRKEIKKFLDELKMLHLNKGISELSIEISKKDNSLDMPDILIGATGVYYDLPVYTHNLKHFKLIKGITLYKEE
ncbi:PIN domain protein [Capnocytophaga gingivalis ATCC 33624]|jgi:putative PIN domain protein|uniref:PIN domain-containing protein n=1 Tax=Capnocytophaga gingivalis TaxID=1017 RepID=UPI00019FBDBB|nr:PIN domain-containing protein [Capnocytophaga gingivalis]EEK15204.1 PIN domain protein [Capnocytophaga gingivalis ATCC 33624]